jgi:DNA-binding transcriptional ArsR family regulator
MNQQFLVLSSPMSQPNGLPTSNGHSAGLNGQAHAAGNGNGNGRGFLPVDWERLARATAHPLRISILEILGMDGGRTLSPSELSQELQIPLSNTNYHVTELAKAKLIELARQRQVRGATEHFYRIPKPAQAESKLHATSATNPQPAPVSQARAA